MSFADLDVSLLADRIEVARGSLMGMLEKVKMLRPVYGYNALS
jgi:hypothetical protein